MTPRVWCLKHQTETPNMKRLIPVGPLGLFVYNGLCIKKIRDKTGPDNHSFLLTLNSEGSLSNYSKPPLSLAIPAAVLISVMIGVGGFGPIKTHGDGFGVLLLDSIIGNTSDSAPTMQCKVGMLLYHCEISLPFQLQ